MRKARLPLKSDGLSPLLVALAAMLITGLAFAQWEAQQPMGMALATPQANAISPPAQVNIGIIDTPVHPRLLADATAVPAAQEHLAAAAAAFDATQQVNFGPTEADKMLCTRAVRNRLQGMEGFMIVVKGQTDPYFADCLAQAAYQHHGTQVAAIILARSTLLPNQAPPSPATKPSPNLVPLGRMLPPLTDTNAFAAIDLPAWQKLQQQLNEDYDDLLAAYQKVIDATHLKLVNMSLGPSYISKRAANLANRLTINVADQELLHYARAENQRLLAFVQDLVAQNPNTLFVFAAGNDGVDLDEVPARDVFAGMPLPPNVVMVGALGGDGQPLHFSNHGAKVQAWAAAAHLATAVATAPAATDYVQGTSMAAAVATRYGSWLLEQQPSLTVGSLRQGIVARFALPQPAADAGERAATAL